MKNEVWIPILDYAKLKRISISTVRRYIKSGRVVFKKEGGRFLISVQSRELTKDDDSLQRLRTERDLLESKLKRLEEENNDLKMLVRLYEDSGLPEMGANQ